MCKYCEEDEIFIEQEITIDRGFGWTYDENTKATEIFNNDRFKEHQIIIIDRGYLRLCDLNDYNCLDHSEKIKVNYCPMCGKELN